jgi:DNA repair protein RadC
VTTAVYPRKIAENALRRGARAIMLAHNHLSGSAEPFACNWPNARTIKIARQYLELKLVDHMLVAANRTFSFKENGLL